MRETKKACELCKLPVETQGFKLKTKDGEKVFCCEGCKRRPPGMEQAAERRAD